MHALLVLVYVDIQCGEQVPLCNVGELRSAELAGGGLHFGDQFIDGPVDQGIKALIARTRAWWPWRETCQVVFLAIDLGGRA
ncbi:hypothetical protein ALO48_200103 [Pseudomonas syringae pv. rhaphiolepidis]|nr:hypothetical protein ALO48_200103 [Pseudomonas syringae pv. rhaphiolepidis]